MSNTLFTTKAYDLVRRELFAKCQGTVEKSDSIWICCPFHGESTPSCKVNTSDGIVPFGWYYCFGCRASGPWNKIAEKIHATKFSESDLKSINGFAHNIGSKFNKIRSNLTDERSNDDLSKYDDLIERNKPLLPLAVGWRGISKELLDKLGCQRLIDKRNGNVYLIIPISVDSEIHGLIRARWVASTEKNARNYINSEHGEKNWSRKFGLLGYDFIKTLALFKKYKIVFLVEGPRDAMRLLELGVPALAIIGSTSWSSFKRDLVLSLEPELVCSLMDNDKAGRKAGQMLVESFRNRGNFHEFKLPHKNKVKEKIDPMSLTNEQIKTIWKKAKGKLK